MTVAPMGPAPRARLYRNARVLLPTPAPGGTDAVATIDGTVVAVGTSLDCASAIPHDAEVVDLGGRTLAPGFIDAHLHPLVMCVFERQLVLDQVSSLQEVMDAIADQARSTSGAVVGFQLDEALLDERRLPTADELEGAGGGRPVVIVRRDGHHAVASSSALASVGLDRPGSDPAGGLVERDRSGRPTGLVRENAVAPLLGLMDEVTIEELELGLDSWRDRLVSQGITGISAICQTTPEGPAGDAGELETFGWSMLVDRVPFDVQTILIAPELAAVHDARRGPLHRPGEGRRVDAVKLFLDGTLGGHTACMHEAFSDRPGATGIATLGLDEAYRRMVEAHTDGLQICIHAIGDLANRNAAELYDRLLREHPGDHRHRVEHASVLDDRTIDLFAEHAITAVVQPISLRSESHWLDDRVGPQRIDRTYPFRTLLDRGVPVAGSSDAPIERTAVLPAMQAATDRRRHSPAQAITASEALALFTSGAAAARRTEDTTGSIAVGRRADLVVLDADPTSVPADALASIQVLSTVIAGEEKFRHPTFDPESTTP